MNLNYHPDLFSEKPTPILKKVVRGRFARRKAEIGYRLKYRAGRNCKICSNRVKGYHNGIAFNKCALIGISRTSASDIRLYATCRLFIKGEPFKVEE